MAVKKLKTGQTRKRIKGTVRTVLKKGYRYGKSGKPIKAKPARRRK